MRLARRQRIATALFLLLAALSSSLCLACGVAQSSMVAVGEFAAEAGCHGEATSQIVVEARSACCCGARDLDYAAIASGVDLGLLTPGVNRSWAGHRDAPAQRLSIADAATAPSPPPRDLLSWHQTLLI